MYEINWLYHYLPNIPIYEAKLPKFLIDKLWRYIDDAKINCNKLLAGTIESSLKLNDKNNYLLDFLAPIVEKYLNEHCHSLVDNITGIDHGGNLFIQNMWVNFQNEHEFNPSHNHTGIVSFVIWMKIPTESADQKELPISKNSNNPSASDFEFLYSDILGKHQDYRISMGKEKEGVILVFPASLRHQVYPFYECDEQRISISGNIGRYVL